MKLNFINTIILVTFLFILYIVIVGMVSGITGKKVTEVNIPKLSNYIFVPKPDTNKFSLRLLEYADLKYPQVHILINFKETSACRGSYFDEESKRMRPPSLCADEWTKILGFNLHNYSGMKYPRRIFRRRSTTSIGSIGTVYKKMLSKGFVLPKEYKWMHHHLVNNPHAVYTSALKHAQDLKLWQDNNESSQAKSSKKYIEQLRKKGYNPYNKYYDHPTKGLHTLYKKWKSGSFQRKNNKYYLERMGISLYD